MPKYDIDVELLGNTGNAFAIIASVTKALRRNDVPKEVIDEFSEKAMSGDYNHLLKTVQEYVNIC